jgi:hypothetical protein
MIPTQDPRSSSPHSIEPMLTHLPAPQHPASTDDASTVSQHIILWTLLTIITNTMAQSAALDNNHTVYYHSSPLYSLAHSIWNWIQSLILYVQFKFKGATFAEILWHVKHPSNNDDSREEKAVDSRSTASTTKTWPRWLFFVLGTLPATIKLCSFSGVPWGQVLGLMSFTAFVLNEIYHVLSRTEDEQPDLGTTERNWLIESKEAVKSLDDTLYIITALLYLIFSALNLVFITWAALAIWGILCNALEGVDNDFTRLAQWAHLIFELILIILSELLFSVP